MTDLILLILSSEVAAVSFEMICRFNSPSADAPVQNRQEAFGYLIDLTNELESMWFRISYRRLDVIVAAFTVGRESPKTN